MATVLVFGELKALVSAEELEAIHSTHVGAFREEIQQHFPALQHKTFAIAVNQKIAKDEDPIPEHAEIALMPPFSGG